LVNTEQSHEEENTEETKGQTFHISICRSGFMPRFWERQAPAWQP